MGHIFLLLSIMECISFTWNVTSIYFNPFIILNIYSI